LRKIHTKSKKKAVEEVRGEALPSKTKRVSELLELVRQDEKIGDEEDILLLTDYGALINELTKEFKDDITLIRGAVLEYAKANKVKKGSGKSGQFSVGGSTETTYGGATALAKILKKYDKLDLFDEMTKIKVTEVKRYLGEQVLIDEGFVTKKTNEYGKVTLKRK
jgi:hypothetical protein